MQNPKVLFGFAVSGNEDEAVKTKDYHENQQEKFCVFNCHLLGFNTEKQEAAINTQSTAHVEVQSGRFHSVRNFRATGNRVSIGINRSYQRSKKMKISTEKK